MSYPVHPTIPPVAVLVDHRMRGWRKNSNRACLSLCGIAILATALLGCSRMAQLSNESVHQAPGAAVVATALPTAELPEAAVPLVRMTIAEAQRYLSSQTCQTCPSTGPLPEVKVVAVESAQWSDTGLGCSRPKELREHRPVLGFVVLLQAEGWRLEYHTDQDSTVVLCSAHWMPASGSR
jgi:hypothetical protein